jgi:hypothetical protein
MRIPRVVICALALLLVAAGNEPAATVIVDGVVLSYRDVLELTGLSMAAGEYVRGAIVKRPADMPKSSPYAYYAGTDAGGKPIVWVSESMKSGATLSAAQTAEAMREAQQAGLLAALATGKGSAAIQRLYAQTKSDPEALATLGTALESAMSEMSGKTVEYARDERRWIFRHIPEGTTRAQALAMLRDHGLVASERGDTTVVTLPGAFEPGCYFSTNVTLTFADGKQLYKIDLSQPIPDCL